MFDENPRFVGRKFPEITNPKNIEKKYVGKFSSKALRLMNGMLKARKTSNSYIMLRSPIF